MSPIIKRVLASALMALQVTAMAQPAATSPAAPPALSSTREIGAGAPWASYYGAADDIDLARLAAGYRLIDIDADPGQGNFTRAQIARLKADGRNRVISYLNLGSCERFRDYWKRAPAGFIACGANRRAHLGSYSGYRDEIWMNPADADYRRLIVDYVAKRLAAQGVDGFYLDNLELAGHGIATRNGPCDKACAQGALDLVRELREAFPDKLLIMQNGTGRVTLGGMTGGVPFPSLLDGIAHEEVFAPKPDAGALRELLAWQQWMREHDRPDFWIGTLDYVGDCRRPRVAADVIARSRAKGLHPSVSDASAGQGTVCWGYGAQAAP